MADEAFQRPLEPFSDERNGALANDGKIPGSDKDLLSAEPPVKSDGPDESRHSFPIAGIGASAGGVEAYIELFENLSHKTGMAFVVVPHLSTDQRSYLPEIVARHTSMPIITIQSGLRPEPDHVYLLPPNARASLKSGLFHLESPASEGLRGRPIDAFFESLASEQKNLAIGVVLSGMDSDGAIGMRSIKGEGGITIVQSPESARFPDMPRSSISSDHVDMVLPPAEIGRQLAHLAQRFRNPQLRQLEEESPPPPDEEQHLARIVKLLRGVSGVDFRLYKPTTIRRRIGRRMLMHRIDTLAEYAAILKADTQELDALQEDILISVTRFFRDPEVFEALKQIVFPSLFAGRAPDQQVRIWVPGCSSGEEVYSIAMCLLEHLTGNAIEPPIQIFGTDASEPSIQKARSGTYPETIVNEVSPERLRRFFIKTERGYQVTKRVRDLCIFARQNLCNDPAFSRLDLVSCRNVLIYFGAELQKQLIPTFHYSLRPEGFLLLGSSETIRNFTNYFSQVDRKHKIYAKIGNSSGSAFLDVVPRALHRDLYAEGTGLRLAESLSDLELKRTADRIVLARYGPPGVIVNEQMEILQSRGHTGSFLELAPGNASLQLSRMVRESIAPRITAAVRRAIDQDLPVQVQGVEIGNGDQSLRVMLEVLPMHAVGARTKSYLVLFVPSDSLSRLVLPEDPELSPAEIEDQDKDRLIVQLQRDISSTRLYLQSLLEERDAKNQELISANEEIQSANEELQSTNEELETTKEELQSSNEELQTVNDELQNRNSVLTQASNDLQNLLNSVNLPVLMLSNEFTIRHFTPQTQRLMSVRPSDVGRPFADIRLNLNVENLQPIFSEVLDTLSARELEVQDREGHWYLLRVRPYRTTENKIEGLVVVLVDIDQLRRTQQGLRDARDFADSVLESIPLPLVVVDSDFKIRSTNEAFCTLAGASSRALASRFLPDLAAVCWGMEQPLRSLLESLIHGKSAGSFEFEYKSPNGSSRCLLVRGRPLQPDGEPFLLITFEDMTAQKEVERLLKVEGQRLANEVESTNKELDRSREELRGLTANLLNTQEEERRRLARELHDDFSQRLGAVNILNDQALSCMGAEPEQARAKLEQSSSHLAELADDIRNLSHRLHPSIIEDLGLHAALRQLTDEFGEREGMIVSFFTKDVPLNMPVDVSTGLYRIAQEALRNVAKHAEKTHVKVQLLGLKDSLELQISDSGKGFDTEQKRTGLGLISMRERALLIGASITIESAVRRGTRVTVRVPLSSVTNQEPPVQ